MKRGESFIRKTAEAAIIAGAIATTGAAEKQNSKESISIQAEIVQTRKDSYRLDQKIIEFEKISSNPDPRVLRVLRSIAVFEGQYKKEFIAYAESHKSMPPHEALANKRKQLWDELHIAFPELPKKYTESAFYGAMTHMPEKLAPYGIMNQPGFSSIPDVFDKERAPYDLVTRLSPFSPVDKKDSFSGTYFGHNIKADVLTLGNPLFGSSRLNKTGQAMTLYGNIFLYNDTASESYSILSGIKESIRRMFQDFDKEAPFILPDNLPNRMDVMVSVALNDLFNHTNGISEQDSLNSTIAHEMGHVLDHQDRVFQDAFKPSQEYFTSNYNNQESEFELHRECHAEVDGILSSLRYGMRDEALVYLLTMLLGHPTKDFPAHRYASRWIWQELSSVVLADPKKFGVHIQDNSQYKVDEQVLIALPSILRGKPQLLDNTWEELWKLHRTRLDENIYQKPMEESVATQTEPIRPEPKPKKGFPITEVLVAGVGGFAALLAAQQAKRYREKLQREYQARQEKLLPIKKALEAVEGGQRLFESLQLDAKPKSVDRMRRELAYESIVEIARQSGKVRAVFNEIKKIIGKE